MSDSGRPRRAVGDEVRFSDSSELHVVTDVRTITQYQLDNATALGPWYSEEFFEVMPNQRAVVSQWPNGGWIVTTHWTESIISSVTWYETKEEADYIAAGQNAPGHGKWRL